MVSLLMGRKRRYLFTSHLSSSSGQGPYSELTPTAYLDLAFFAHFYLVLVAVYLEFYQRPPPPFIVFYYYFNCQTYIASSILRLLIANISALSSPDSYHFFDFSF